MAYGLRYQYEFQDWPPQALGLSPYLYRVSFYFKDWTGSAITLTPDSTPLVIENDGASNNVFRCITAQKYTFRMLCESKWQASTFYVKSDRDIKVVIEVDQTYTGNNYAILRQGWVLPDETKEKYQPKPYPIEVSAACGLSTLKTRQILDANGKRLTGRIGLTQAIRTILGFTDLTNEIYTAVNLYELRDVSQGQTQNGNAFVNRDPLFGTSINAEALLADNYVPMNGYDALIKILQTFRCTITQLNGVWWIVRVPELAGGWDVWNAAISYTVRVRHYSHANVTAPADSNASVDFRAYVDFAGSIRAEDGAETYQKSIKPGVRVEQDFGRSLGVLPNSDFSQVDSTGLPVFWTSNNLYTHTRYVIGSGTEEDPYRLVIEGGTDEKVNNGSFSVSCRVDYPAGSPENTDGIFIKRTIRARARLTNVRAAKVWLLVIRDDEPYLFSNGGWKAYSKLKKADSVGTLIYNTYTVDGKIKAKPGWFDINVETPAIDRVYHMFLYLGEAEALDDEEPGVTPKIEYTNVRIDTDREDLPLNGTQQTIVQPGKSVEESTLKLTIGDVPKDAGPSSRTGTLFRADGTPTQLWFRPDADVSAPGHGIGDGKTLLSIATQGEAKQQMNPVSAFDADLIGRLPMGPLTVLMVSDIPELGKAVLPRWEWHVDECRTTVTANRLMEDDPAVQVPTVKEWNQGGDIVPMPEGEDGEPIAPAKKTVESPNDALKRKLGELGVSLPQLQQIPGANGFTQIETGKGIIGANIYIGNQLKGQVGSALRRKVNLTIPL